MQYPKQRFFFSRRNSQPVPFETNFINEAVFFYKVLGYSVFGYELSSKPNGEAEYVRTLEKVNTSPWWTEQQQ